MKHFFRGERGLSCAQSDKVLSSCLKEQNYERLLLSLERYSRSKFGRQRSYEDDRDSCTCPEECTPTVYQLSSAQDLPWFYLCSASPRSACDCAVTRLRSFIGASSQSYRSVIGAVSEKGRTWLGLGRVLVGTNAGIANAIFRPISTTLRAFFTLSLSFHRVGIEWASNWNRVYPMNIRCVRVFDSINYRKRIEDNVSESIQRPAGVFLMDNRKISVKRERQTQPKLSHALAMPCLYTGYEQETPKNGTRNCQETYKDCTRMKQETPKREARIRQESRNSTSKNTAERYCRGTGKVLKSEGKGTGEVLESYQRGTKEVLTGSRSVVALEWDRDCFGVVPTSTNDGRVVNDPYMNRLVLKGFSASYEDFRCKVESIAANGHRGSQIALKGMMGAKVKSKPFAYSLQLIALMIFCVFSFPDLLGTSAMAQSPHRVDIRQAEIMRLQIGDTIPEALWRMPLKVVNYPDGNDTILLKAYRSEPFILLDFWSTHCAPCIRALNEFDKIAKSFERKLPIISMHVDSLQELEKYVSDKGWTIPVVGVNESTIVNNYFFNRKQYGGLILIMDGIFYASPDSKVLNVEMFEQLLRGERPRFETKYPELLHSWRAEGEGRW